MRLMLSTCGAVTLLFLAASWARADVVVEVTRNGDLVVESDDQGNGFEIRQLLPGSDAFQVVGDAGTLVNGVPMIEVTRVRRGIRLELGSGGDQARILDAVVRRDVDVRGGSGGTSVRLERVEVAGKVHVRNGDGEDTVRLHEVSVGGKVDIDNGDGGAYIGPDPSGAPLAGTHIHDSSIGGRVTVRNGVGSDYLHLYASKLGDGLRVDHGPGAGGETGPTGGTTHITGGCTICGDVTVKNGYGRDELLIQDGSEIQGSLEVENGDGAGSSGGTAGSATRLEYAHVAGKMVLVNGYGSDALSLKLSSIDCDLVVDHGDGDGVFFGGSTYLFDATIGGDLVVKNGYGFDSLTIQVSSIAHDIRVCNGDGSTAVEGSQGSSTYLTKTSVGGGMTIESGYGRDTLRMWASVTIDGDLCVDNGEGSGGGPFADGGYTDLSGLTVVGDVEVKNRFGVDAFLVSDCIVGGRMKVDNGTGGSTSSLSASTLGDVHVKCRDGADRLDLGGDVLLEGDLHVDLGDGNDEVRFLAPSGGVSPPTIQGKVKLKLGDGDDRVTVYAISVWRRFDADGGKGTDTFADQGAGLYPPGSPRLKKFETVTP